MQGIRHAGLALALAWLTVRAPAAERVRVATWNLENYRAAASGTRPAKMAEGRAKIVALLSGARPDVVALQELGSRADLADLQAELARDGLPLPHAEFVGGSDTNIFLGVLSRFPFGARRPHTNDSFLLTGRRFRVSRGFAEVEVAVAPRYTLTLITAHLKSRRAVPEADEAELRLEEARLLRQKVDARLAAESRANLIVLGDFNDVKGSPALRALLGRGRGALVDTRPAERNGDHGYTPNPRWQPRTVTWTYYYGVEDSYDRVDYILIHPNLAREWVKEETFIVAAPDWGVASDHRLLVITFEAEDR